MKRRAGGCRSCWRSHAGGVDDIVRSTAAGERPVERTVSRSEAGRGHLSCRGIVGGVENREAWLAVQHLLEEIDGFPGDEVECVPEVRLLGRGAAVPTLVIFLGAIGGFILSGFIGLFTGAVVLSIGYRLMMSWMAGVEKGLGQDAPADPGA